MQKRECPACGEIKQFRNSNKTCGCIGSRSLAAQQFGQTGEDEEVLAERLTKSETKLEKTRIELAIEKKQNKFLRQNVLVTPSDIRKLRRVLGDFKFPIAKVPKYHPRVAVVDNHSEDAVALISDTHFGDKSRREDTAGIAEYNLTIGGNRLGYNTESIKQIIGIHSSVYKIDTLHLAILGDICHGKLHDSDVSNDLFVPAQVLVSFQLLRMMIKDLHASLVQKHFVNKINLIFCVGNHGRIDPSLPMPHKFQSLQTYDRLVYDLLIDQFKETTGIQIRNTFEPFVFENIQGHRYLFSHGLGVGFKNKQETQSKSISQYIANARAIFDSTEYRNQVGLQGTAFDRACIGDVHAHFDYPDLISNGSLSGNNELGINWMLRPIEAGQAIFGVSKRHKQTWKYFLQSGHVTDTHLNPYGIFARTFLQTWGK